MTVSVLIQVYICLEIANMQEHSGSVLIWTMFSGVNMITSNQGLLQLLTRSERWKREIPLAKQLNSSLAAGLSVKKNRRRFRGEKTLLLKVLFIVKAWIRDIYIAFENGEQTDEQRDADVK